MPPPARDGPVSLHNSCHPHRGAVHKCAGFPGDSEGEVLSACNAGDLGLILRQEDPLEKAMAPHSSTLAWKIPLMEEPGRLQSMGSQRVGQD